MLYPQGGRKSFPERLRWSIPRARLLGQSTQIPTKMLMMISRWWSSWENLTGDAARWWAAILAPGEGWKAAIPHERWRLLSPWSVTTEFKNVNIILSGSSSTTNSYSPTPASYRTALKYIDEYSILHNASTQSRAALAAALLLPLAKLDNRKVQLHVPRGLCRQSGGIETPRPSLFEDRSLRQIDRLLTLSANARGMTAILGSIFYESNIPANACGAWL